ncbi:unnamed protein product [Moneuplotes crassus]|uniref:Uncharacterized protein n=1 Tax=Euplotes crassus TaxID=5936 RepID=A0AAD1UL40_EUPCR|nr:unnamed protein product [Moneuplotes crassus]
MEEFKKQQEENRKKYIDYIERRRQEIKTRQSDVLDKLNRNLSEKYAIKKKINENKDENKQYSKDFLKDIISRLPKEKPQKQYTDINEILNHLQAKRQTLATKMGLPVPKESVSFIEDAEDMVKAVSEEDVKMFIIPGKAKGHNYKLTKKDYLKLSRFHHPKQTIAEYFKDNKSIDLNTKKIEKFLEHGVLDNVLFNFLFSRGLGLKDGLIDIDRAYLMIRKINESELDFPEKVPDQPLNDDEKLEIVCSFMKRHPQLLLQAIPDSKKQKQKIHIPDKRTKKKEKFPQLPKSTNNMRKRTRFRTIERDQQDYNVYSGKLKRKKNELLRRSSNSPAVPMPSHSRLSSYSNRVKNFENSLTSDFKMVSQGINFEVEPTDIRNKKVRTSMSHNRPKQYSYLRDRIPPQSRENTSSLMRRPKYDKISPGSNSNKKMTISTRDRESTRISTKPKTAMGKRKIKSNISLQRKPTKKKVEPVQSKLFTINTSYTSQPPNHPRSKTSSQKDPHSTSYYYSNITKNRLKNLNLVSKPTSKKKRSLAPIQRSHKSQVAPTNRFSLKHRSHDVSMITGGNPANSSYGEIDSSKAKHYDTIGYDFNHEVDISDRKKRDLKEYFNHKKFIAAPSKKSFKKDFSTMRERNAYVESDLVVQDRSEITNTDNYSTISKNLQFKNVPKIEPYFSEKNFEPKFTESILKENRKDTSIRNGGLETSQHTQHNPCTEMNQDTINQETDINRDMGMSDIKDHPSLRASIPEELTKEDLLEENPQLENNNTNQRNDQLSQLIYECYYDQPQKHNASQVYRKRYAEIDTTLHWSKAGKRLPVDDYKDSIVPQTTIEQENLRIAEEENKQLLEQQSQKMQQQKILEENQLAQKPNQEEEIDKSQHKIEQNSAELQDEVCLDQNLLNKLPKETSEESSKLSTRFYDPSENQPKKEKYKIKNIDWHTSAICKDIENTTFDPNCVSFEHIKEIVRENTTNNDLNSTTIIHEEGTDDPSDTTGVIKEFIKETLESSNDCMIRYNEVDALLALIKERFSDFKRSKHLDEFFKSASFTLYALTLNLCLPETHFYRIMSKYEEITYENTIKLIIRCKIFYEARTTLCDILTMISEREYTAALLQTEIASLDSCDQAPNTESTNLRASLKLLHDQSTFISDKISQFRTLKSQKVGLSSIKPLSKSSPFDRPFLYKEQDYTTTMKRFDQMLSKVLEVHEISIY